MSEVDAEVLADEEVEAVRTLPAVRAAEAMVARGEVTLEDVVAQREKIKAVMEAVMTDGVHYGNVPGVSKPTLLKPGAEVLAVTFRLAPSYQSERVFHDDDHLTVVAKATLTHIPTSLVIAEGEGLCTSREKKYAFRGEGRTCPSCGAAAIKKSKFPPRENDYPGASRSDAPGWYCHAKVGGCGANFAATDEAITGQEAGKIANPDLPDTWNTVLKMANKRALVAAILNGTAASDIFTQDVEDLGSSAAEDAERSDGRDASATEQLDWKTLAGRLERHLGGDAETQAWIGELRDGLYRVGRFSELPQEGQRHAFSRLSALLDDLDAETGDVLLRADHRAFVASLFARHFDGFVVEGPAWALGPGEAEARPARPTDEPGSSEVDEDIPWPEDEIPG